MERLTSFFEILYSVFGFVLIAALGLAIKSALFSKRSKYKAEFRHISGRVLGEFDMILALIEDEVFNKLVKVRFRMRHESLRKGQALEVYVDETLVITGKVRRAGRISLRRKEIRDFAFAKPAAERVCRVVWGGIEQFRAPLCGPIEAPFEFL